MRHLFRVENIDRWGSNWPLGAKMCFFDPKIWMNKMVARKTIVSLVWNLLIGWAVWIIVNFIEKTVSA